MLKTKQTINTLLFLALSGFFGVQNDALATGQEKIYDFNNPASYFQYYYNDLTEISLGLARLKQIHNENDIPNDNTSSMHAAVGDFNNDGDMDIYSICYYNNCHQLHLGDGNGNFVTTTISGLPRANRIVAVDFNNDENLDVYITSWPTVGTSAGEGQNTLLLGDGNGGFTLQNIPGDIALSRGVSAADFNHDGNIDLYVTNYTPYTNMGPAQNNLYLGNGDGTFYAQNILGDTGQSWGSAVADYNNDGRLDLYVAQFGYNKIYFGDGTGDFLTSAIHGGITNSREVISDDFNSDGNADVYVINHNSQGELYYGDGNGGFTLNNEFLPSLDACSSDFNSDGHIDFFLGRNIWNNWYFDNGNGSYTTQAESDTELVHSYGVACADVNNDGVKDVYVSKLANSQNKLYLSGYSNNAPSIKSTSPFVFNSPLRSFTENLTPDSSGQVVYQLSLDNGFTWLYFDGAAWVITTQIDGTEANLALELNYSSLSSLANSGSLIWRAYLISDGTQKVEIDKITVSNKIKEHVPPKLR